MAGAGGRDRDRPAGRALRRLRRPRVHRPDGGGARRDRPRRARMGAAAARLLRSPPRPRGREAPRAQAQRLHDRGDRRGLLRRPSDGHPPGRNGRFLACSLFPEHKESRPLPGEEPPPQAGTGEVCPECGEGTLVGKRGRFGPFVGCSRYPDCKYIKKDGPPPPDPLPFEVVCPKNKDGHLVPRRARRTGNVFWGCSNYPRCDYTSNDEPLGGIHDTDDGPIARKGEAAICLLCGSTIEAAPEAIVPGQRYPGGPANPEAIARPARGRRPRGRRGSRQGRDPWSRPGPVDAAGRLPGGRDRPNRPRTRERGRIRPCDQPGSRPLPSDPCGARRVATHATVLRHRHRRLPRVAGRARHRLAHPGTRRPPRLPGGARGRPCPLVGRATAGRDPLVPSLGGPRRARAG